MSATSFVSGATAFREFAKSGAAVQEDLGLLVNQFCALLLLLLLGPLMIVVAVLIWRRDGMPIVFDHYRVGYHGKLFACLKFRTMYVDAERMLADLLRDDPAARAEWARDQKLANDPRITPIGKLLRKTSLDDLPQLFNVLRGEMTLVGPRPITVDELDRYGRDRWHYLAVRPGITGLWQVSGRNDLSYSARVALDREYVETRSVWLDLTILWYTVGVVLNRSGAL
jgi:exopolysaccharide production protein ExoY